MNVGANWELLTKQIKSCNKCEGLNSVELCTENAPGYGNKESKVVLIGQSLCGKKCIEAQIPFTGGSGKLLDQSFELAGIDKRDIYITNVVKCHPRGNRKSEDHEIENCSPYLENELKWISPKTIICLGKDAWGYFDKAILEPCAEEIVLQEKLVTAHFVYHPSFIMRNPKPKRDEYMEYLADIIKSANA